MAGGKPEQPECLEDPSLGFLLAIQTIRNRLLLLLPRPCILEQMSATPGRFIPVLHAILGEYRLDHQQASTIPRLFSTAKMVPFQYYFKH